MNPIRYEIERVSAADVDEARKYQAAMLADIGGRRGTLDGRIVPLGRHMKLAGPAFTVEVRPGDNLMFHAALALARPGDVIVVDGKGDLTSALCGAIMSAEARAAGIAGFVVYGAVRDTEELRTGDFPIFSLGANPNGPTRNLPGRINWPVSVGGTAVNPGDLVVGDCDGVVIVPRESVSEVLSQVSQKCEVEKARFREIAKGNLRPAWLESALNNLGLSVEKESG